MSIFFIYHILTYTYQHITSLIHLILTSLLLYSGIYVYLCHHYYNYLGNHIIYFFFYYLIHLVSSYRLVYYNLCLLYYLSLISYSLTPICRYSIFEPRLLSYSLFLLPIFRMFWVKM